MKRGIIGLLAALAAASCAKAPAPYGTLPSPAQVQWQRQELIMFYHYGQATFSGWDGENGSCNGTPWSEDLLLEHYAPEALDVDQWVKVAADNGFKEVIITAKHHDGFCLWDNPESTADIANPACKNPTDVVQAVRDACNKYGVRLGIYFSPWDRVIESQNQDLATYEAGYKRAAADLMTRYAPVVEFWLDGNHAAAFDWPEIHRTVLEQNPDCIIFSDGGPGCRWVGNERGRAGETNWATLDVERWGLTPGNAPSNYATLLAEGDKGGPLWVPAECDFSIQEIGDPDGWFYDPADAVKSGLELLQIYYSSVGRGGVFLMNVPPSPEGVIAPKELAAIEEFTAMRRKVFETNLAEGAGVSASSVRGKKFGPEKLLDGEYDSYFAAPDEATSVSLEFKLPEKRTFNRLVLQEYIPLGQRVESFSVQYRDADGQWQDWQKGTTIGYKRILLGADVTTDAVRVTIEAALACPVLNGFGLYYDPYQ
ncbi:MAG: alpha-L-fucosidase [Bacteroidales bacterium]|nr:alpha-L-fucosidase [Bacteroidales bacterium]